MLRRTLLLALFPAAVFAAGPSLDHAIALHTAGRLPEALREYQALAGSADSVVAATALSNACVIQNDLGEYKAALPDCRRAVEVCRSLGDPGTLARALNNLGLVLESLGETKGAERSFLEALEINRKAGAAESEAVNLSNLGTLALGTGSYTAALELHARAAALAARHSKEPWAAEQERIARINEGVVLEKVGAFREALDLYKQVLAAGGELDPDRRAALLVNTGTIYRNLGDPVRATDSYRQAIDLYRQAGDTAGLSNANLNLALALHLNLEKPDEAEAAYREALRLAEASGDRTEEIQDLFYLGRLLLGQGRLPEAEALFRRCLAAAEASGSAEGRWSAREGLGRTARARGDLNGALSNLQAALDEIERVRAGLARGSRRAGYFGDKRAVYQATVETLAALERRQPGQGWAERALGVVQRAKARDLLDALGGGGTAAAPQSAGTLRKVAGEGAVLEYFQGETGLYLWIVRAGGIRFLDLGDRRPVLDAVAAVHRALSHGEEPPASSLEALSRVLLGSAGPLPRGDAPLWIAPDGALHHLPFEILTAAGEPLVERAPVSYLPSASALAEIGRPERKKEGVRLLGVGDPLLDLPKERAPTPRALLVERFGLAPLPAASRELAAVGRLLGGKAEVLTRGQATERAFRQAAAREPRVVHLATHTVIDERPGRGAAVLLTPEAGDDGLLSPEEIARVGNRSDLTVLAACRTALGPGEDGQALASLTGAFLAAGSRGVVATLWDVNDATTAAFMEQFYWQLGRGLTPAEALRETKRRLRADPRWRRPALWAGYVLIGDPPAVAERRLPGIWALGLALAAVTILIGWRWLRR
ncbi:MAG TPA: CHAT domain-containing tetratricopeptide repeat protein [Thermoanaerobaculia bacterium]